MRYLISNFCFLSPYRIEFYELLTLVSLKYIFVKVQGMQIYDFYFKNNLYQHVFHIVLQVDVCCFFFCFN